MLFVWNFIKDILYCRPQCNHARGSPHPHSFICIFNAPNIKKEAAFIDMIERTINAVAKRFE